MLSSVKKKFCFAETFLKSLFQFGAILLYFTHEIYYSPSKNKKQIPVSGDMLHVIRYQSNNKSGF